MTTTDDIQQHLTATLQIMHLDITDDSDQHQEHAESQKHGGGHYSLRIVSPDFKDCSRVERHRLVHQALKPLIGTQIHALALTLKTPDEAGS